MGGDEGEGDVNRTSLLLERSHGDRGNENDRWQWLMDGEENGKLQPFAQMTLQRK
jgi:hypothetical protein